MTLTAKTLCAICTKGSFGGCCQLLGADSTILNFLPLAVSVISLSGLVTSNCETKSGLFHKAFAINCINSCLSVSALRSLVVVLPYASTFRGACRAVLLAFFCSGDSSNSFAPLSISSSARSISSASSRLIPKFRIQI